MLVQVEGKVCHGREDRGERIKMEFLFIYAQTGMDLEIMP